MTDESFPMIPGDLLMAQVDAAMNGEYTQVWGHNLAVFYQSGRHLGTVALRPLCDVLDEAVVIARWGAAVGADQVVWFGCAMQSDAKWPLLDPEAQPQVVLLYADREGTQRYADRAVSILDDGRVVGAGALIEREPGRSALLAYLLVPWLSGEIADSGEMWELVIGRGHRINSA